MFSSDLSTTVSHRSQAPQAAGSLALHYLPAFTYAPIRFVHSRSRLVSRSTNIGTRVNDLQDGKQVSAYLPASDEEGYFLFESGNTRTPALRAGAVEPYTLLLPGDWKEIPVSNAKSGNYCQPRCDEATTEVQFASPSSGTIQVIIIPTNKLMITEKLPRIDTVGSLAAVLEAVSPAITGSVAVEEEEILSKQQKVTNGWGYYEYELLTPFAAYGLHNIASVTTSQNYVVIATAAASERQWESSEKELRKIVSSFRIARSSQNFSQNS